VKEQNLSYLEVRFVLGLAIKQTDCTLTARLTITYFILKLALASMQRFRKLHFQAIVSELDLD